MTAVKLHTVEEGVGPPAILLHGFPEFHYSWRNQIPALTSAGIRVLAPDLRGYNLSPKPQRITDYRMRHLVDDVVAIAERQDEPCAIVGHDWGGLLAWYLAMSRPDLVRRLVVLNLPHPSAISRVLLRSTAQKMRFTYQLFFQLPLLPELMMRLRGRKILRRSGRFTEEDLDRYETAWRGSLKPMLHYYRALPSSRPETKEMTAPLQMPSMLIWGEREPVMLPETVDVTAELVPGIRIERIANAGHFVQTDAPQRVNELLVDFLR